VRNLIILIVHKEYDKIAVCFKFTECRKTPTSNSVVYRTPCSSGKKNIGQMASIRIAEHIRGTRLENKWSAVAEHPAEIKYSIRFYIAGVMDNIHTHHLGLIREAIATIEYSRKFKHKDGCSLSQVLLHLYLTTVAT
jgi:hypothetical protein